MSRVKLGPLDIEVGGLWHRRLGLWLPDGLHIWLGRYGVHIFWAGSPYMRRITFEREEQADAR
jgi:hypothetical protein